MRSHEHRLVSDHTAGSTPGASRAGAGLTTAALAPRPSAALPAGAGFVQRRADERAGIGAGSYLDDVLAGGGAPLPGDLRSRFEGALGTDLADVRVHTGDDAARSAASLGARAYATGSQIVMGAGAYQPGTAAGEHLLAHEVAHTVQQRGGASLQRRGEVSTPGDAHEVEADRAADAMVAGQRAIVTAIDGAPIQRDAFVPARNRQELVVLLAEAERLLLAAGRTREEALHMITSIFYGGSWSRDHQESQRVDGTGLIGSQVTMNRDANFAHFTGRAFDQDPRPILGDQLFRALQGSQDVAGTDVGHLLIGMDARMRQNTREQHQTAEVHGMARLFAHDVPTHATGAEAVTWVGDLGGAAARLAADRHAGRQVSVETYFNPRGTDYGAPSNLNGDLAGMTAGRNPNEPAGPGGAPLAGDRSIAQVVDQSMSEGPAQRAYIFLQSLGGTFTGRTLTNRAAVVATMADRIGSFAPFYIQRYDGSATAEIPQAARDVAERFMQQLERDVASGPISVPSRPRVPRLPEGRLPEAPDQTQQLRGCVEGDDRECHPERPQYQWTGVR